MPDQQPPDSFLTLANEGQSELKVQRSRFIAVVSPAEDETQARQVIKTVAARYHDSRHACFAWRLGVADLLQENRNDDGEPAGTAGEPILTALRKSGLTNAVGVVIRYFGGIKLGTGGLQRAYGQAAEAALTQAPTREVLLGRRFLVDFPYAFQKTMGHLLAAQRGKVLHEQYSEKVRWQIWAPHSTWQNLEKSVTEASAGQVNLKHDPDH